MLLHITFTKAILALTAGAGVFSIVAAIIKEKPGQTLTEEDVNEYCEELPRYKRPRKVIFGEVPRSPTGKIEKPKLRKQYTGIEERIGKLE